MNKKSIFTILIILILPVAIFWWFSSGKDSVADANTNMPQIIKFSSTMCLECKEVEKIFKEILPKYEDQVLYKAIIVDSRKDMDNKLIKKYNIQLVPTVIMLDSSGKVCQRIEGAASKDEYETYIQGCK